MHVFTHYFLAKCAIPCDLSGEKLTSAKNSGAQVQTTVLNMMSSFILSRKKTLRFLAMASNNFCITVLVGQNNVESYSDSPGTLAAEIHFIALKMF
jgi:hypothetical protein